MGAGELENQLPCGGERLDQNQQNYEAYNSQKHLQINSHRK